MDQHTVLIVGGGNAGISLAALLLRDRTQDVTIVDAQEMHRYRPLLSYVGAGEATMRQVERPLQEVVPDGCTLLRDHVVGVDPESRTVTTRAGRTLGYQTLVLCPGLAEDWQSVPGLAEAYADGWAASTFVADSAARVWPALAPLRRGSVLFTVPPEPAPCGATALKPLFMACDHWRRTGVLPDLDVTVVLPRASAVGVPKADSEIENAFSRYGIQVLRETRLTGVDGATRGVTLTSAAGSRDVTDLAFAHLVPPYRGPDWIADSGLAANRTPGLVDVDPGTMRHLQHESIWSLGDVADLGIRPSGGALRKQVDVLAHNIGAAGRGDDLRRYDGYTVMPITTSRRRLMLVEVDRSGRLAPSVPVVDLVKPRRSTWLFDRYGLPIVYFRRILRGKV